MKPILNGKRLFLLFDVLLISLLGVNYVLSHNAPNRPGPSGLQTQTLATPSLTQVKLASTPENTTDAIPLQTPFANATSEAQAAPDSPEAQLPSLTDFIHQVTDGEIDTLRGLYVQGTLALRVVQQPGGDPNFISREDGTATQFYQASVFGAIGLLAHNFLSGRDFFNLRQGQDMVLVYGDGKTEHFHVSAIADYQRLSPSDVRSDFRDLATNQENTVEQVFARFYQNAHQLTLQTCIERNGLSDWGVRFIVADPAQ